MTKIALFCAAGMSTSLLVGKMKKAAEEQGLDVEINAYPETELEKVIDHIDIALLGPQVRFLLTKAKAVCGPKNIPIAVIDSKDYGMMNGEKVLQTALNLAN